MEFDDRELMIIRNMFMITTRKMIETHATISEVQELQNLLRRFKEYDEKNGNDVLQNN